MVKIEMRKYQTQGDVAWATRLARVAGDWPEAVAIRAAIEFALEHPEFGAWAKQNLVVMRGGTGAAPRRHLSAAKAAKEPAKAAKAAKAAKEPAKAARAAKEPARAAKAAKEPAKAAKSAKAAKEPAKEPAREPAKAAKAAPEQHELPGVATAGGVA